MRFPNTRSNTSMDLKTNSMHLSHVYHGTFAAFRRFIHLSVCLCAGTFKEKSKYSRECFDGLAFLANEIHRSICPAFKNQCFSAPAIEEDGGVF